MALAFRKVLFAALASALSLGCLQMSMAADQSGNPELRKELPGNASTEAITPDRIKKDYWLAFRMAKYPYLEKVAEADPRIIAAICTHSYPARELAMHRHLDKIAEVDHYLCRRLCQWEGATQKLLRNPHADQVIALDPQGMAFAMNRKPEYARLIARHPMFNNLADTSRDFPREMTKHIR